MNGTQAKRLRESLDAVLAKLDTEESRDEFMGLAPWLVRLGSSEVDSDDAKFVVRRWISDHDHAQRSALESDQLQMRVVD